MPLADFDWYLLPLSHFQQDLLTMLQNDQQNTNDLRYWTQLVEEHFSESGALYFLLHDQVSPGDNRNPAKPKQYEICHSLIPRFFWHLFEGNVEQVQLNLEGTNEAITDTGAPGVFTDRARMVYWFKGQGQVCQMSAHEIYLTKE